MKTNSAGELTVPVDGIYYIYLQLRIIVRVTDSSGKVKKLKLGHLIKIRRISWNSVMERYESLNYDDSHAYETTNYYGGLHYLKKGDTIAIMIRNPCRVNTCSIEVYQNRAAEKSSFYGAFLVTPVTERMMQGRNKQ